MTFFKSLLKSVAAASMLSAFSTVAIAGENPSTVVELFTSQGCSSCPPANAFVGALSEDEDRLVLTYGVTYWDYLGWKDTFGDQRFTERQRAYGKAFGIGNVYTPQIVLNGSAHSPRYQTQDVDSMALETSGALDISVENGRVLISGTPLVAGESIAVLVSFKPGWQSVDVSKGENHGRTLRLANVVTDVMALPINTQPNIDAADGMAYAVLVHDPVTQKITNAAVYTP